MSSRLFILSEIGYTDESMSGDSLRLSIVSSNPDEITVAQFKKKADELGIEADVIPITLDDIATGRADKVLGNAVLWRLSSLGPSGNGAGWELLKNRISINTSLYVMPEIGNKYFQQQVLRYSELSDYAVPTFYVGSYPQLKLLIDRELLTYPIVVKPVHGSSAQGVTYIENDRQASVYTKWEGCVVETYIENDGEWRVFVVGGVATGAMKKVAAPGKKFNLVGPGAQVSSEKDDVIRDELYDLATRAASLFYTELNGVDIVRNRITGKLKIFEVNVSPGWQNRFDKTTGEDIPARVLEWISDRFSASKYATRQVVTDYMVRRSHRLPLADELRLLDMLFEVSPAVPARMSVHKPRLVGGSTMQRIKTLAERHLSSGEPEEIIDALRVLSILKRRYGYTPEDAIGSLWSAVMQQVKKLYQREEVSYPKTRSAIELMGLCIRLGISHIPGLKLENIDPASADDSTVDEAVAYLNGILLYDLVDEAGPILDKIKLLITENFYEVSLANRLEFAKNAKLRTGDAEIRGFILSQAKTLQSWAGNFLVEDTISSMRISTSTKHRLLEGYYASALYCQLAE